MEAVPPAPAFSWTSGEVHADVLVGVALLGALWAAARRAQGEPVRSVEGARFGAGLLVLLGALNGPLHDLADYYLFSAHMVQHLLLTLVVPPLLLAGTPAWMLDGILAPLLRWRATRPIVRVLVRPLPQFALYTVALVAWHLPGPYGAALERHGWHIVEHLVLIGTAILGWWPVLSPSRLAPQLPYGAQILYLFAFGIPMTVVAAMITGADEVLYAFYATAPRLGALGPLEDQRLGGIIMWVPAGLVPLVAFTVVFFRWAAAEADAPPERTDDREADEAAVSER
ncbi:MAG: cytochrome c oxidase assembly protein [Candidatus Rokubacteria bacterium]|nr:cytochrome c oxidase assembly protein [Candidatus Rokubacteria bacterium]